MPIVSWLKERIRMVFGRDIRRKLDMKFTTREWGPHDPLSFAPYNLGRKGLFHTFVTNSAGLEFSTSTTYSL
jgi:hypothetical protein